MTDTSTGAAQAATASLAPNTPRRFYRGGERVLDFRGVEATSDFDGYRPEDWIGSTARLFAEGGGGVTTLEGGVELPDAFAADAEGWFGTAHVSRFGGDPNLLTKLLDSGERLPVHSHPSREFAMSHLDCDHGKTEAWIVLVAEPGATVWVGFHDELAPEALAELVDAQDDRLLAALNPIPVSAGDAVLVPAGQPHAIGQGVLILELQEPTDFSVMLEHERFALELDHAFLGLDRSLALQSVDHGPLTPDRITTLRRRWADVEGSGSALPTEADAYFRAQVVRPVTGDVTVDAAYAAVVVVDGSGTLSTRHGTRRIAAGDVLLVPHCAGDVTVSGEVTLIRCMPPTP
ncbi:class I mannose-6-phosphate isomerase [Knoellia sp. Soil729]|uniref:class I mannose-6-phosphate isomerase n=1 Tax=Knoellia sp. Soil729 TaxID=1736394 RepID=UPI0006FF19A1|nr:class I mannose-6-phosphate isomerase [Knoellia sp. Soil729]KRE43889.1 phosphoheptose isomerase [Knoellia sp. Soil729]